MAGSTVNLPSFSTHFFDCSGPHPPFLRLQLISRDDERLGGEVDLLLVGISDGTFQVFTHTITRFFLGVKIRVPDSMLMHHASRLKIDVAKPGETNMLATNVSAFFDVLENPVEYGKVVYSRPAAEALTHEKLAHFPIFDFEHYNFFSRDELVDMMVEFEVLYAQNLDKEVMRIGRVVVKKHISDLDHVRLLRFFSYLHGNPKFQTFMAQGSMDDVNDQPTDIKHGRQ